MKHPIGVSGAGSRTLVCLYLSPTAASSNPSRESNPINVVSALLALATGLVHASLAPVLAMGDVRPNLILAAVVAVTVLIGMGAGATWAFVGGLTANLLTTDALGTIPLGLLLVVGTVTVLGRALGRRTVLLALAGGAAGSVLLDVVDVSALLLQGGTGGVLRPQDMVALVIPGALVNGLLALVLYLLARAAMTRLGHEPMTA